MPIDINFLREEKGGNVEAVKESQRRRFKDVDVVDRVIDLDKRWRQQRFTLDNLNKEISEKSKMVGEMKKKKEDTTTLQAEIRQIKDKVEATEKEAADLEGQRDIELKAIGNLVHDSVPVSNDEANNKIERTWGPFNRTGNEYHHHQVLWMVDGYSPDQGVDVAGHRAYFLRGCGVRLNQALINFGLDFLERRDYLPLQPPFFMNKDVMAETAQLSEYDEALYKVIGQDDEKYLIATSEQPISAYHRKEWLQPRDLPKKYAGVSTCFRKEAGAHGKDAWGIFRIHQFEKVEQFVVCAPEESWQCHEEMVRTSEEFLQALGLSHRVVNIVSGELNNAAAKKYDVEAWFPALGVFRELVSASNCTDYQARAMDTRFGVKKGNQRDKMYVHMLNATLCATERTLCCILENYQTEGGLRVPKVLQCYMGGKEFIPFTKECPKNVNAAKIEKAKAKKDDVGDSAAKAENK